jgi:hypothetical protein
LAALQLAALVAVVLAANVNKLDHHVVKILK